MAKKRKDKKDDLDTETTFANMNVEGFSWYNPNGYKKKLNKTGKVSRKEYWAMVRGMFAAILPLVVCMLIVGGLMFALAVLWLK